MTEPKNEATDPRPVRTPWLLLVLVVLLATEALLWLAPVADPYERLKRSAQPSPYIRSAFPPQLVLTTDVEPGLPGMQGPNRFTTNAAGFRGPELADPKPTDEYRIFLVGGSSTEGFYLDDSEALHATVAAALQSRYPKRQFRVYNAGKSGDRSDDHLAMITQRIIHAEPDLVIVFAGINDLFASLLGYDFRHRVSTEPPPRFGFTHQLRFMLTELQLPRRLFYLAKHLAPPNEQVALQGIPLVSGYAELVALRQAAPETDSNPPVDTASFARNLRALAGALRANRVATALITQQTTWAGRDSTAEAWQWMRLRGGRTWRADKLSGALERLNDETRKVAAEFGIPLVELTELVPKTSVYFYDDVHFTAEGARVAGEAVAATVAAALNDDPQALDRELDRPPREVRCPEGIPAQSLLHEAEINLPVASKSSACHDRSALLDLKEHRR